MRAFLACAALIIAAMPGAAQAQTRVECSATVEDDVAGELTFSLWLDRRTGKAGQIELFWLPVRSDAQRGVVIASPGLMLDYRLNAAGEMVGPSSSQVLITLAAAPRTGAHPGLDDVQVKIETAGQAPITWDRRGEADGHVRLTRLLRGDMPDEIAITLTARGFAGEVAFARYRFPALGAVDDLARKMRQEAEAAAATWREAVKTNPDARCAR